MQIICIYKLSRDSEFVLYRKKVDRFLLDIYSIKKYVVMTRAKKMVKFSSYGAALDFLSY